jgi:hypothetical protein
MTKLFCSVVAGIFFFFFLQQNIYATISDSCLSIKICNDSIHCTSNIGSMLVDTCNGELYARGWFQVEFTYFELPAPWGPEDTIIDRHWEDTTSASK